MKKTARNHDDDCFIILYVVGYLAVNHILNYVSEKTGGRLTSSLPSYRVNEAMNLGSSPPFLCFIKRSQFLSFFKIVVKTIDGKKEAI